MGDLILKENCCLLLDWGKTISPCLVQPEMKALSSITVIKDFYSPSELKWGHFWYPFCPILWKSMKSCIEKYKIYCTSNPYESKSFNPSLGLNSIQMDYINNELFEASTFWFCRLSIEDRNISGFINYIFICISKMSASLIYNWWSDLYVLGMSYPFNNYQEALAYSFIIKARSW